MGQIGGNNATMTSYDPTPHLLGFIRGAYHFGQRPDAIRLALGEVFPRLSPQQIETLMRGAQQWAPPPPKRILS